MRERERERPRRGSERVQNTLSVLYAWCTNGVFYSMLNNGNMNCIVSDYWSPPANKSFSQLLLLLSVWWAWAIKYIYWNRLWCCHNFTANFTHIYTTASAHAERGRARESAIHWSSEGKLCVYHTVWQWKATIIIGIWIYGWCDQSKPNIWLTEQIN